MEHELIDFDDFDGYDTALVHLRSDGTADVRVNKERSTGSITSYHKPQIALSRAKALVADPINGLKSICVALEDGAVWDDSFGTLTRREPLSLSTKPFR